MKIKLKDILVEGRLREIDEDHAQALAHSIGEHGQSQSVIVRPTHAGKRKYTLVIGGHRFRAHEILGLDEIEAEVRKMNATEARLAEIDENLIRAELTALDRALFLAERKKVYEELHPETKKGGDRKSSMFENQSEENFALKFTADAAERVGLSPRSIEQAVFVAQHLPKAAVQALRGTPEAKNFSRLLNLARMEPDKRDVAVRLFAQNVPLNDAMVQATGGKPKSKPDHEIKFDQLVSAWAKAPRTARVKFLQLVGETIDALREEL